MTHHGTKFLSNLLTARNDGCNGQSNIIRASNSEKLSRRGLPKGLMSDPILSTCSYFARSRQVLRSAFDLLCEYGSGG